MSRRFEFGGGEKEPKKVEAKDPSSLPKGAPDWYQDWRDRIVGREDDRCVYDLIRTTDQYGREYSGLCDTWHCADKERQRLAQRLRAIEKELDEVEEAKEKAWWRQYGYKEEAKRLFGMDPRDDFGW